MSWSKKSISKHIFIIKIGHYLRIFL